MGRFYLWCLRKYLSVIKIREGETIVLAFKSDFEQRELEAMKDTILDHFGEKVVMVGGVDKVIVAN